MQEINFLYLYRSLLCTLLLFALSPREALASRAWCERLARGETDAITSTERAPSDRSVLRDNIAALRSELSARSENEGYWGPGSILWRIAANPFLALTGEKTLYLQLGQPVAAQGVADHSQRLASHFVERFQSTFNNLWKMIYGTRGDAERIANGLFMGHSRITGTMPVDAGVYRAGEAYSANDPEAALWVAETFLLAMKESYELGAGPLNRAELDQFAREGRRFAMLFGVPSERIPRSWAEIEQYFFEVTRAGGELEYTPDARRVERHHRSLAERPGLRMRALRLLYRYADAITTEMLPEHLAREFGLERSLRTRVAMDLTRAALRRIYQRLPDWARTHPMARIAQARVDGRTANPRDQLAYQVMAGRLPADLRAVLSFAWPDAFPVEALPVRESHERASDRTGDRPDWSDHGRRQSGGTRTRGR